MKFCGLVGFVWFSPFWPRKVSTRLGGFVGCWVECTHPDQLPGGRWGVKTRNEGGGDINMLLYKSGNYTRHCFVYINFFNFNLGEKFKVTG